MPTGKPYPKEFKEKVCKRAIENKKNGFSYMKTAKEFGIHYSLIGKWVRKFDTEKIEIPAELIEQFEPENPEPFEPNYEQPGKLFISGELLINNLEKREQLILILVSSGYTVSQTEKHGHVFINYQ